MQLLIAKAIPSIIAKRDLSTLKITRHLRRHKTSDCYYKGKYRNAKSNLVYNVTCAHLTKRLSLIYSIKQLVQV